MTEERHQRIKVRRVYNGHVTAWSFTCNICDPPWIEGFIWPVMPLAIDAARHHQQLHQRKDCY